eukprot:4232193-Pyramimonas_sp.AAC.1
MLGPVATITTGGNDYVKVDLKTRHQMARDNRTGWKSKLRDGGDQRARHGRGEILAKTSNGSVSLEWVHVDLIVSSVHR